MARPRGRALQRARLANVTTDPETDETDESGRASTLGEGTSSRPCSQGGAADESTSDSGQSTSTAAVAATDRDEPGCRAPDGQLEELPSKAVLQERSRIMFLLGKGRLNASGGRALVTALTRRVLLDASEVISDFD